MKPIIHASAAACLLLAGCGGDAPTQPVAVAAAGGEGLPVRVAAVGPGRIARSVAAQGRLEAGRRALVTVRTRGFIAELAIEDGQQVAEGGLVARLDPISEDLDAARRADAELSRATRELERRADLARRQPEAVSAAELDAARDAVADARIAAEAAAQRARDLRITAPFAGVLTGRLGTIGQQVAPGFQLGELQDRSRLRLLLDLPETTLRDLGPQTAAEVTALADAGMARASVAVLPAAIDPAKGTGRVVLEIAQPPPTWRPGGFATAALLLGETLSERTLPRSVVLYRQSRPFVWVVEPHDAMLIARRAWIEIAAADDKAVAIVKGVNPGERVVVEGMTGLSDGVPVTLREDASGTP